MKYLHKNLSMYHNIHYKYQVLHHHTYQATSSSIVQGASSNTTSAVQYQMPPLQPLSPWFDPHPLRKFIHLCNDPHCPCTVLFWTHQSPYSPLSHKWIFTPLYTLIPSHTTSPLSISLLFDFPCINCRCPCFSHVPHHSCPLPYLPGFLFFHSHHPAYLPQPFSSPPCVSSTVLTTPLFIILAILPDFFLLWSYIPLCFPNSALLSSIYFDRSKILYFDHYGLILSLHDLPLF